MKLRSREYSEDLGFLCKNRDGRPSFDFAEDIFKICGSRGCSCNRYILVGSDALSLCRLVPSSRRNLLPPSSW